MRRALLLPLALSACLDTGVSIYDRADTIPPRVEFDQMNPRLLGPDAGVPTVAGGQRIDIVFSEPMDPQSLRPGILIRMNPERTEVPLIIQAPPPGVTPYTVRVLPVETYRSQTTYTFQLRSLLIDLAGNPITDGPELTGFFFVQ
jgi:hypothetical protein